MYSKCDFCWLLANNVDRVFHFTGWQLIRLLQVFESVATQWIFTTVSVANLFCGCFCWVLAPFAVCFAVLWMVRRKSGWGICVLPFVFGGCDVVFMICLAACGHLCPCRCFLDYSFFSCKDRAFERDRPYQRKKTQELDNPVSFALENCWTVTLKSDKQHYLEHTTRRMT